MKRFILAAIPCLLLAGLSAPAQPPAQDAKKEVKKAPTLPEGVTQAKGNAYGPHERNKIDLYVPKSDKPLPVLLWIHGGGWEGGDKGNGGPTISYLSKGYAVAAANYRLSQHAVWPAQIEDCKSAVRWLRANAGKYNLDKDRIGCVGTSAGGHLVALLGTAGDAKEFDKGENLKESSRVQAVCDWFGPTDLSKLVPANLSGGNPVSRLLGGSINDNRKLAESANPLTYCSKDDAPFLILHGDKDPLVPLNQSEILNEALKKCGVECELCVVKDAGHSGQVLTADNAKKMEAFFEKHLKVSK